MKRGTANYFERSQYASDRMETDLCEIPVRYVPLALSALEGRKAPSFWLSEQDWYTGYQAVCEMQWGLLMGAREDLIREIRGVRGSGLVPDETSLEAYPVGEYPGAQLKDIVSAVEPITEQVTLRLPTMQGTLEDIKRILEAQANIDPEELMGVLGQIAALLAV